MHGAGVAPVPTTLNYYGKKNSWLTLPSQRSGEEETVFYRFEISEDQLQLVLVLTEFPNRISIAKGTRMFRSAQSVWQMIPAGPTAGWGPGLASGIRGGEEREGRAGRVRSPSIAPRCTQGNRHQGFCPHQAFKNKLKAPLNTLALYPEGHSAN